uniref:phage head closure protein n=1 Tax=Cronobacter sakazakii TaxID=28141 RepID=UPI000A10B34A
DRDRYLTFKRLTGAENEFGEQVDVWANVGNAWASVKLLNGIQTLKADRPLTTVQASIRTLYRTDIVPGMRAHDGARVYEVKAVLPDVGHKKFTDFVCEVVA